VWPAPQTHQLLLSRPAGGLAPGIPIRRFLITLDTVRLSAAIEKLQTARRRAMPGRPKVGGFPYLAETLRRVDVTRNPPRAQAPISGGEKYIESYPVVDVV